MRCCWKERIREKCNIKKEGGEEVGCDRWVGV